MKLAVVGFACFLSRQQTIRRVIAATQIVHSTLPSPRSVSEQSYRMRGGRTAGRINTRTTQAWEADPASRRLCALATNSISTTLDLLGPHTSQLNM